MNHIIGVGCDIIDIERIKEAINNSAGFLKKILHEKEITYCQTYKEPYSHYAARFAAKEAIAKAFGVGIGNDLGWHDMEIILNEKKKPTVKLSKEALEKFNHPKIELSLSHTDTTACAFCIAFT